MRRREFITQLGVTMTNIWLLCRITAMLAVFLVPAKLARSQHGSFQTPLASGTDLNFTPRPGLAPVRGFKKLAQASCPSPLQQCSDSKCYDEHVTCCSTSGVAACPHGEACCGRGCCGPGLVCNPGGQQCIDPTDPTKRPIAPILAGAVPVNPPPQPKPAAAVHWMAFSSACWGGHKGGLRGECALGFSGQQENKNDATQLALRMCENAGGQGCKVDDAWSRGCSYSLIGYNNQDFGTAEGPDATALLSACKNAGMTTCKKPLGGCVDQSIGATKDSTP
jgi:hypothetical protein